MATVQKRLIVWKQSSSIGVAEACGIRTRAVDGGVAWAFDEHSKSGLVFARDSEMLLRAIRCPTLVVTGSNGLIIGLVRTRS